MTRRYPSYKSSGVEWIGDIPEHWDIRRLGAALSDTVGGGTPSTTNELYWAVEDEEGLAWVAIADMSSVAEVLRTEKRITALGLASARLRILARGTIIYSMYASVGSVARLGVSATTNQAILGLLPAETLESSYLFWWLTSIREHVTSLTRDNTQSNLNAETVRKIPLALPPVTEQRVIADYLDSETARIDTLISKKRRLIDLLAEYRTSLITQTVTKGLPPTAAKAASLPPNPPLKPSGIDSLGDIPEHWQIKRLRRILRLKAGNGISSEEIREEGDFPVYGGNGIRGFTDRCTHEGDFVLIGRQGALCGNVHLARNRFWASEHAVVAEPVGDENAPWLMYLLDAMNLNQHSAAAAQPGLAIERISSLAVPVPPNAEQQAIAESLDRGTDRIDTLSDRVEMTIERLQEYRTALITTAVTGQIDLSKHNKGPLDDPSNLETAGASGPI